MKGVRTEGSAQGNPTAAKQTPRVPESILIPDTRFLTSVLSFEKMLQGSKTPVKLLQDGRLLSDPEKTVGIIFELTRSLNTMLPSTELPSLNKIGKKAARLSALSTTSSPSVLSAQSC